MSIGQNFNCNKFSTVNKFTYIGNNVFFNGLQVVGNANVIIGNYFVGGFGSLIISSSHNYEGDLLPYGGEDIKKGVIIEDFVWLGAHCIILPGTHIGEGAVIQAGAVVHGVVRPYSIVGGNPAKIIKFRNIEHFNKIKEMMYAQKI
jgi:acetyltransferase-like isoleucine patch superfamily enzyme